MVDDTPMLCGEANTRGEIEYGTYEFFNLCLVVEDYIEGEENQGLAARKLLYEVSIDKFGVLELHGFYDHFKDRQNLKVYALSNGVRSRSTTVKLENGVAQILNLVVRFDDGKVDELDWRNDCVDERCSHFDCKEVEHPIAEQISTPESRAANEEMV